MSTSLAPASDAHVRKLRNLSAGASGAIECGTENLEITGEVDPLELRRLLSCLAVEDCAHSWRNFDREGTLDDLVKWENVWRPTQLLFFHKRDGHRNHLVAASTVSDALSHALPLGGFCVLARCYIMPEFRGMGLYRKILQYRLEYCKVRLGDALKAIHIGSSSDQIARVVVNHQLPGWPNFSHLGEQSLMIAGREKTVAAYLLLMPDYLRKIQSVFDGVYATPPIFELQNALSRLDDGNIRSVGLLIHAAMSEIQIRLSGGDLRELEQLWMFCKEIPLVGIYSGCGGEQSTQVAIAPTDLEDTHGGLQDALRA